MRAVVQRVSSASVRVDGAVVGAIKAGALILLGVLDGDSEREAEQLAEKVASFRYFADDSGKMNLSASEVSGSLLVVSQFTLAADGRKGRRPSFDKAAAPLLAEKLYEHFVSHLVLLGLSVETGCFGAMMEVELVNDGPVTFVLDDPPLRS
ncbi:MAG: D-aminoacyl-tRNA deacylase [Planctomycetota bacterium]|nr:D-aminoacyl-tRNA deacylase [Planctomycetota bacterium]